MAAGYTSAQALAAALFDEVFDPEHIDPAVSDLAAVVSAGVVTVLPDS